MEITTTPLWQGQDNGLNITYYPPQGEARSSAVIVFPGGGYRVMAEHEARPYGEFFAGHGFHAFVADYRTNPNHFPLPLADARRAVRYVRLHAASYGISPDKIAVIGSSAGGHLAALLSTYREKIDFEMNGDAADEQDYLPNAQILCYPVIRLTGEIAHVGSGEKLLGEGWQERGDALSPDVMVTPDTPPAFMWHTAEDSCVDVRNSLTYGAALKAAGVPFEMHIYPDGFHGLGMCAQEETFAVHDAAWKNAVVSWLDYIGF